GFSFRPFGIVERRLDPLAAGRAGLLRGYVFPRAGARRQQFDRLELLEIIAVAAPADEIFFRIIVELLQARLHPLHFPLALVELILAAIGKTCDDDFFALDDTLALIGQLFRIAIERSQ